MKRGSYESPERGRRMIGYTAMGYAIALLLLLGFCCYGVYWANRTMLELLSSS